MGDQERTSIEKGARAGNGRPLAEGARGAAGAPGRRVVLPTGPTALATIAPSPAGQPKSEPKP